MEPLLLSRRPRYECAHCTFTARTVHLLEQHIRKHEEADEDVEDDVPSPSTPSDKVDQMDDDDPMDMVDEDPDVVHSAKDDVAESGAIVTALGDIPEHKTNPEDQTDSDNDDPLDRTTSEKPDEANTAIDNDTGELKSSDDGQSKIRPSEFLEHRTSTDVANEDSGDKHECSEAEASTDISNERHNSETGVGQTEHTLTEEGGHAGEGSTTPVVLNITTADTEEKRIRPKRNRQTARKTFPRCQVKSPVEYSSKELSSPKPKTAKVMYSLLSGQLVPELHVYGGVNTTVIDTSTNNEDFQSQQKEPTTEAPSVQNMGLPSVFIDTTAKVTDFSTAETESTEAPSLLEMGSSSVSTNIGDFPSHDSEPPEPQNVLEVGLTPSAVESLLSTGSQNSEDPPGQGTEASEAPGVADTGLSSVCITDVVSLAAEGQSGPLLLPKDSTLDTSETDTASTTSEMIQTPVKSMHTIDQRTAQTQVQEFPELCNTGVPIEEDNLGMLVKPDAIKTEPENCFTNTMTDVWKEALEGKNVINVLPEEGVYPEEELQTPRETMAPIKEEQLLESVGEMMVHIKQEPPDGLTNSEAVGGSETSGSEAYKCGYCGSMFDDAQQAKTHLVSHVAASGTEMCASSQTSSIARVTGKISGPATTEKAGFKLKCPSEGCSYLTTDSLSLGVHLYFEHKQTYKKLYYCAYCTFVSPVLDHVKKHMKMGHAQKKNDHVDKSEKAAPLKPSASARYIDKLNILQKKAREQHLPAPLKIGDEKLVQNKASEPPVSDAVQNARTQLREQLMGEALQKVAREQILLAPPDVYDEHLVKVLQKVANECKQLRVQLMKEGLAKEHKQRLEEDLEEHVKHCQNIGEQIMKADTEEKVKEQHLLHEIKKDLQWKAAQCKHLGQQVRDLQKNDPQWQLGEQLGAEVLEKTRVLETRTKECQHLRERLLDLQKCSRDHLLRHNIVKEMQLRARECLHAPRLNRDSSGKKLPRELEVPHSAAAILKDIGQTTAIEKKKVGNIVQNNPKCKNVYQCGRCHRTFYDVKERLAHWFNEHRVFTAANNTERPVQPKGLMNFKCYFCVYKNSNYKEVMLHMDREHAKMLNKTKKKNWMPMLLPGTWQHTGNKDQLDSCHPVRERNGVFSGEQLIPTQETAEPTIKEEPLESILDMAVGDTSSKEMKSTEDGTIDGETQKQGGTSVEELSKPEPQKPKVISKKGTAKYQSKKRSITPTEESVVYHDLDKPRVSTRGRKIKSRSAHCSCSGCCNIGPQHSRKRKPQPETHDQTRDPDKDASEETQEDPTTPNGETELKKEGKKRRLKKKSKKQPVCESEDPKPEMLEQAPMGKEQLKEYKEQADSNTNTSDTYTLALQNIVGEANFEHLEPDLGWDDSDEFDDDAFQHNEGVDIDFPHSYWDGGDDEDDDDEDEMPTLDPEVHTPDIVEGDGRSGTENTSPGDDDGMPELNLESHHVDLQQIHDQSQPNPNNEQSNSKSPSHKPPEEQKSVDCAMDHPYYRLSAGAQLEEALLSVKLGEESADKGHVATKPAEDGSSHDKSMDIEAMDHPYHKSPRSQKAKELLSKTFGFESDEELETTEHNYSTRLSPTEMETLEEYFNERMKTMRDKQSRLQMTKVGEHGYSKQEATGRNYREDAQLIRNKLAAGDAWSPAQFQVIMPSGSLIKLPDKPPLGADDPKPETQDNSTPTKVAAIRPDEQKTPNPVTHDSQPLGEPSKDLHDSKQTEVKSLRNKRKRKKPDEDSLVDKASAQVTDRRKRLRSNKVVCTDSKPDNKSTTTEANDASLLKKHSPTEDVKLSMKPMVLLHDIVQAILAGKQ